METVSEVECPFCHEGKMREDSCGCLTCRKCHRVEGTNCNIPISFEIIRIEGN